MRASLLPDWRGARTQWRATPTRPGPLMHAEQQDSEYTAATILRRLAPAHAHMQLKIVFFCTEKTSGIRMKQTSTKQVWTNGTPIARLQSIQAEPD